MYREVLVPVDNSLHSDLAVDRALEICARSGGHITATHVYAARLHDIRFRRGLRRFRFLTDATATTSATTFRLAVRFVLSRFVLASFRRCRFQSIWLRLRGSVVIRFRRKLESPRKRAINSGASRFS